MKKVRLVFIVALACSTTAMAADIAFYVGQWNTDGWYDATQFDDVETIISETGHLFQDIQQFDDTQLDDFGAWVDDNTDDGELDIIWLNGCTPSVLYPNPNVEPDGSRAEEWLDNGNMIINVGDWFAYCTYEGGSRGTDNGAGGAQNILDLSGPIAGGGQGQMEVTPEGQEYLPSLNAVTSDRPVVLSAVQAPWEVAAAFAQNAAGTHADPVVLRNTETGGYFVAINQASSGNWIDDRGLTCAEFIGNWVNEVIGLGVQPRAGGPKPKNGSMISQTTAMLEWRPGAFASVHDVYFGESFEAVEAATRDDPNVFLGTLSTEKVRVGVAGDPYPEPLVPGQTYYWRVDEVNDTEPNSPWKGNVWSFSIQPVIAYNPSPADGVPYVLLNPDLTWEAGMGTLFHTVFFGESYEEVDNMMVGWMTASATIAPASPQLYGPLQPETTYYWRVDEFAMTGVTSKGDVWSFTTVPEIAVSDPDLTGWWTLDEGVGATALDWSGNGNHGTFVGEPVWVDGYHGGALEFGGGDYVDTGKGAADLEIDGGKPKTTMAWALTRGFNGGGLWDLGSNNDGRNWSVRTTGNLNEWRVQRWGFPTYDFDVTVPSVDEWTHFALVYDGAAGGNDSRLYANGEVVANQTIELDTNPTTRTFQIGIWSGTSFDGVIDDVRVYKKALSEAEIAEAMRGNPLLAGSPNPSPGATVDIRDATMLSWAAGDTAVSHDVYFGTDRAAVAAADNSAAEFQGNQPGTSASLAGLVEFGGGDYYWRIDEVEADGTVQTGYIWRFTIPDYLVVEDFESYTNEVGSRVFEKWIDGVGFTQPVDTPGNGTGAMVGHDIWTPGTTFTTIVETGNVFGGRQAMPIYYDNTFTPFRSEVDRTFVPAQNWTLEGVTTLVVHFRGQADNTGDLYVKINGVKVPYDGDPADIASSRWITWEINLAAAGVPATNVSTLTIGIEGGQSGILYVDEILLTKP